MRSSLLAALFLFGVTPPAAADGEPASAKGSWRELIDRDALLEPWLDDIWPDGWRRPGERGVTGGLSITQFYQGVTDGQPDRGQAHGDYPGFDAGGRMDAFLRVDGGKLGLLDGLFLDARGELRYGNAVVEANSTLMPVGAALVFPETDGTHAALSQLTLTQELGVGLALSAGRFDLVDAYESAFTGGRGVDGFMNLAFVAPHLVSGAMPPVSALGAAATLERDGARVARAMVYDLRDSYTQFGIDGDLFAEVGTAADLTLPVTPFGLAGRYAVGGGWATGDWRRGWSPDDNPFPALSRNPSEDDDRWTAFLRFDQMLYRYGDPDEEWSGIGVFGRIAWLEGDSNALERTAHIGVGGNSPIPSRHRDRFGIGWFHVRAQEDVEEIYFESPFDDYGDEHGFELFYDAALTGWLRVAIDYQRIDPSYEGAETETYVGFRAHVDLAGRGVARSGARSTAAAGATSTAAAPAPVSAPAASAAERAWSELAARSRLLGDPWGVRGRLAERGIVMELSFTQFYQGPSESDRIDGWDFEYASKTDAFLAVDGEKLGLWRGLSLRAHSQLRYGDAVLQPGSTLVPVGSAPLFPAIDGTKVALTDLVLRQRLGSRVSVSAGRFDLVDRHDDEPFTGGRGVEKFQNLAFVAPSLLARTTPPVSALGAELAALHEGERVATLLVYDPRDSSNDVGLDSDLFAAVAFAGELTLPVAPWGRPGHYAVGGSYSTQNGDVLDQPSFVLLPQLRCFFTCPVLPAPKSKGDSWSVHFRFDQTLLRYDDPVEKDAAFGAFGRLEWTDGDPSVVEVLAHAGLGGESPIPGRRRDRFGAGWYYAVLSDAVQQRRLPFLSRDPLEALGDENGFEVFYDAALTGWLRLAADLQIVEPFTDGAGRETFLGLRARIEF